MKSIEPPPRSTIAGEPLARAASEIAAQCR